MKNCQNSIFKLLQIIPLIMNNTNILTLNKKDLLPEELASNYFNPSRTGEFKTIAQFNLSIDELPNGATIWDMAWRYCQNGIGNTEFEKLRCNSASVGHMFVNHTTNELVIIQGEGFTELNPNDYLISLSEVTSKS